MKNVKIVLDIVMTVCFILLMKIRFVGLTLHELIGIGIFFLFIIHNALNYKWIIGVFKGIINGNSTSKARFMFGLNVIILLFVFFNVLSGILISKTILTSIEANNIRLWSNLHKFSAYCSLILLSVHIGLHWQMIMNTFKKFFKLNEANQGRTLIARVTLIAILFLGLKAIANPIIYRNFTMPFKPPKDFYLEQIANVTYISRKDSEEYERENSVQLLTTNGTDVEIPSLEEYLSSIICTGCGKHCLLTNLQCTRGTEYKNEAIIEYQKTYEQNDLSESESENSSIISDDLEPFIIPEDIPNQIDNSKVNKPSLSKDVSVLDYIGIMGIVISGTHYTVSIPNKIRERR